MATIHHHDHPIYGFFHRTTWETATLIGSRFRFHVGEGRYADIHVVTYVRHDGGSPRKNLRLVSAWVPGFITLPYDQVLEC